MLQNQYYDVLGVIDVSLFLICYCCLFLVFNINEWMSNRNVYNAVLY